MLVGSRRIIKGLNVEAKYRFDASLSEVQPIPGALAELAVPISKTSKGQSRYSASQEKYLCWAKQIMDSCLDEKGHIRLVVPPDASDKDAVLALDFFYRVNNPHSFAGALEFRGLKDLLSSSSVCDRDATAPRTQREVSIVFNPRQTLGLSFTEQRKVLADIKRLPAEPIEQLLAAMVRKCRSPLRPSFSGIIRGCVANWGFIDSDRFGIRRLELPEDGCRIIFMSASEPKRVSRVPVGRVQQKP